MIKEEKDLILETMRIIKKQSADLSPIPMASYRDEILAPFIPEIVPHPYVDNLDYGFMLTYFDVGPSARYISIPLDWVFKYCIKLLEEN